MRARIVSDLVEFHTAVLPTLTSLRAQRRNLAPMEDRPVEIASSPSAPRNDRLFFCPDDPDQVLHLADHAPHRGRVFQRAAPVPLVEPEPFQRRLLVGAAADRAAGLLDRDGLL